MSYDEFLELTEHSEQRFELIDGIVYNLASPAFHHQYIIHVLSGTFYNWFQGKSCIPLTSPLDITLRKSEDNICVVQPDIVVTCDKDNLDDRGKYQVVPALAVEVLSPTTRSKDLTKKLELYMLCGVKEYWIVDPMNEMIQLYSFENQDIAEHRTFSKAVGGMLRSIWFDGLTVPLAKLF